MTLNATETCDCGAPKTKRVQFCKDCWEQVPEELHNQFTCAVHQLQYIVKECRSHLPPYQPPTATAS